MSDRTGLSIFDDHYDPSARGLDDATEVIPVVTAPVQRGPWAPSSPE